mmetsp:Transcript_1300/g.3958  ORF Transcript_1300/g.3958 Transcript_1300/m.3958 type:complete len:246 (+) Transcript_1300:281-1018(+)|eukprot:CAMPEP_0198729646 /NCGR_PEP_ID=MMETSP1475-20131203/20315_1 /TAXON_ID= ORGANISM="Unidentified sp., Strain CCMP1999" /NCGR_SAMPLE_ID=MMETSP1475 /ASSEMBLY_ACC=CAM_ASM_001111 /LENGTH=245 /DNA_ID=CAMNT_0044492339 /DNA_START=276 /DNA_END=1013 /DNA_ORIENTATION=-
MEHHVDGAKETKNAVKQAMLTLLISEQAEELLDALETVTNVEEPEFLATDVDWLRQQSHAAGAAENFSRLLHRVRQYERYEQSEAFLRCQVRVEIICRGIRIVESSWKGKRTGRLTKSKQGARNKRSNRASTMLSRRRNTLIQMAMMVEERSLREKDAKASHELPSPLQQRGSQGQNPSTGTFNVLLKDTAGPCDHLHLDISGKGEGYGTVSQGPPKHTAPHGILNMEESLNLPPAPTAGKLCLT